MFDIRLNRENIEWTNTWIENSQDIDKERILLIGDSIAREIRSRISNAIEKTVDFIGTSSLYEDPCFYNVFNAFFDNNLYKYSSIIISLGAHAGYLNTSKNKEHCKRFKNSFEKFIQYCIKKCPNITILYITPQVYANNTSKYNKEMNLEICHRNKVYEEVAIKHNLKTIDIYSYILNNRYMFEFRDHCHFANEEAKISLANYIANSLYSKQHNNKAQSSQLIQEGIRNIPIFLASDENYAPFLCTTMYSILNNTSSFIEFHILDGGIAEKSKNLIKQSLKKFNNYSTKYHDMSGYGLERFPNVRHYSLNTFSRYFIPELVPELDKVLYIDVDVVVNGDIAELYNIDLEDKALAAVPENFYLKNGDYVKGNILPEFENTENYFNAGVMLLNIKKFVENDYSTQLINMTIKYFDKLACPDQDVFNILFEHDHVLIDYKYNYMPDFYEAYKNVTDNVENLDNSAIVYHYTCGKPWKNKEIRKSSLFWEISAKTPFFEKINTIYNDTCKNNRFYKHWYERVFSSKNNNKHKVITILGIRIKLKKNDK